MRKFLTGFTYAWSGITYAVRTQVNIRVHLVIAVLVLLGAWYMKLSAVEFMILTMMITIVLAAELFNTAIEAVVDLVSPEYHPLAKIAKDVAAGAVLVCAMGAVVVGAVIVNSYNKDFIQKKERASSLEPSPFK